MARNKAIAWLSTVYHFYADGFRNMTVGRKLWTIIIIKLVILFGIFRLFFFPDILKERYDNDRQRAEAVSSELLNRK
jgi:hypothetical protein